MNIVRKINTGCLSAFQMIINLVVIVPCLCELIRWTYYLCGSLFNDNAFGVAFFAVLFGLLGIPVLVLFLITGILSGGIVLTAFKTIRVEKRKTVLILGIINTVFILINCIAVVVALIILEPVITGSDYEVLRVPIIAAEVISCLWNFIGLAIHLVTDIPYFIAQKRKTVSEPD